MEQSITTVATDSSVQYNEEDFYRLPFEDKRIYLTSLPSTDKIELILSDPDAKRLIRAMLPQELYWLFKEIDVADAMELLGVANPRQ
ncbi:MAG: DUF6178 family protein, partial [Geobacter sp.]|nr:DUF6178 family protein [Geobacter sp.]